MTVASTAFTPNEADDAIMRAALNAIAENGDCEASYSEDPEERERCTCSGCEARWALARLGDFRYAGAMVERQTNGFHPREAAIVEALKAYFGEGRDADRKLKQVLHEPDGFITRRDWYVAVSVVQWLATNVGMSVLEAAGFKYTRFEEDRKAREALLPTTLTEGDRP